MKRGTRLALGERLVLSVALASLLSLAAPPETRADSAANAVLLPWPIGQSPAETALSGGLSVLRARGSLMIRVPTSEFVMGSTSTEIIDSTLLCEREPLGSQLRRAQLRRRIAGAPRALVGLFFGSSRSHGGRLRSVRARRSLQATTL